MQNVLNNQNKLTNKVGLHQFSKNHFARDNQQERDNSRSSTTERQTPFWVMIQSGLYRNVKS